MEPTESSETSAFENWTPGRYPKEANLHLHTRYCSTVLYKRSVTNISIKLFNKLPVQIKQLDNYKCFNREVNNFLLNNSFYTIEEFLHFEGI